MKHIMIPMNSIQRETEKLRLWLKDQNISEINRRTGIGRTTLWRFAKGGYKPTLTVLSRLAEDREKSMDRKDDDGNRAA